MNNAAFPHLEKLCHIFDQKKSPEYDLTVKFIIDPPGEAWFIEVKPEEPTKPLTSSDNPPNVILKCSLDTLSAIVNGEMTGLTAMGRENMSDTTPLDFQLGPETKLTPENMALLLRFVQRFLNPTLPEKVALDRSHARLVHGGWAIPMFYHSGFRSAWYQLDRGQQLNGPGDTNPFPQALVFISGSGYAKFGESSQEVHAGEAYYIPPGSEHIVRNESDEPLNLIFLAWGEGA